MMCADCPYESKRSKSFCWLWWKRGKFLVVRNAFVSRLPVPEGRNVYRMPRTENQQAPAGRNGLSPAGPLKEVRRCCRTFRPAGAGGSRRLFTINIASLRDCAVQEPQGKPRPCRHELPKGEKALCQRRLLSPHAIRIVSPPSMVTVSPVMKSFFTSSRITLATWSGVPSRCNGMRCSRFSLRCCSVMVA